MNIEHEMVSKELAVKRDTGCKTMKAMIGKGSYFEYDSLFHW